MIIYRTFDGEKYEYYARERVALDAADRFYEQKNFGPNGFVRVEKITLREDLTANALVAAVFNDHESAITDVERVYERLAS